MHHPILDTEDVERLNEMRHRFRCVDLRFAECGWWAMLPDEGLSSGWCLALSDAIRKLHYRAAQELS